MSENMTAEEMILEERRKRYAQQLRDMQVLPAGQMVGNQFVPTHPLQHIAEALRRFGASRGEDYATQELADLRKKNEIATQQALNQFSELSRGSDMRQAYAALMAAPDNGMRNAAIQGMTQIPIMEERRQDRLEDRDFRRQSAEEQRQFQREMMKERLDARASGTGATPYIQPIQTANGVYGFNTRTGMMQRIMVPDQQGMNAPGGAEQPGMPVIGAAADPELQGKIAGAKERGKLVTKQGLDAPKALQSASNSLKLVNDIINHPALDSSVGMAYNIPLRKIAGTPQADFENRLDQIKGASFLTAFEQLRGGGAITEIEGQKATNAINRMNSNVSKEEFIAAAKDLQDVIRQGMERAKTAQARIESPMAAQNNASGQYDAGKEARYQAWLKSQGGQ